MDRIQDKSLWGYLAAVAASILLLTALALPGRPAPVPEPVLTGVAATLLAEQAPGAFSTPIPSATSQPLPSSTPAPSPTPSPTPYASPTFVPTVPVPDGLALTVLHPWQNEAGEAFEALVEEFNQAQDGNPYRVRLSARRANGFEDLANRLSSEESGADIVIGYGYDLAFMDRGDYWSRQGGMLAIHPERDPGRVLTQGPLCDGCAPAGEESREQRMVPILWQPALLAWNETWAQELGLEGKVRNIAALREQTRAASQALLEDNIYENNGAGGLLLSHSPESALAWYTAFGGAFDPSLPYPKVSHPEMDESLRSLKQLFLENCAWNSGYLSDQAYFAQRWTLLYEAQLTDIPLQLGQMGYYSNQDTWLLLPYPSSNGEGSISLESIAAAVKSSDQARQQAAWSFVRYLLSVKAQSALAELSWLWPVIGQPAEVAPGFAARYPQWPSALSPQTRISFAPETKNWAISRLVVQDAVGRVYGLDPQYFGNILISLDATLEEMEKRND